MKAIIKGNAYDLLDKPEVKIKDWFYAKNITKTVPSEKWTHILGVAKETEKAVLAITYNAYMKSDLSDEYMTVWVPKSCTEPIPEVA